MGYQHDLNESMVRPSQIIAMNRPFMCISSIGIHDSLEYLEEEILSRGGYQSMGRVTRGKYELEISGYLEEIAYRN
jgi:hypothetical protein